MKFSILFFFLFLTYNSAQAWESEQYSMPKEELADIGPLLSQLINTHLDKALDKVNKKLAKGKNLSEYKIAKIVKNELFKPIAKQINRDAIWGRQLDFFQNPNGLYNGRPVLHSLPVRKTVYGLAGFHRLFHGAYVMFSSTIKAYGVEFGFDKTGHSIAEGFKYYRKYTKELKKGRTPEEAFKKMVKWGVKTEKTYYGKIIDGVYSNADLVANYLGFRFYQNLFERVTINGVSYPAILVRDHFNRYQINLSRKDMVHIYKRMVSLHLNEAFNPSHVERLQRPFIRRVVKKRCNDWKKRYPNYGKTEYQNILKQLSTIDGLDYGHRRKNLITIGNMCF